MYTQKNNLNKNCSDNFNRKIRRMGEIWKKVAAVFIAIAGIYTIILVGNAVV